MSAFRVRRLNESDLEDFRRVRLEALYLHPQAFGASYEEWNQRPSQFFADKLNSNVVFGGFDLNNTLQGIIGLSCNTSPKLRHVATLWGMYVRTEMRRSGLSLRLVEAVLEAGKHVKTIQLSVVTTNHAACALYRSFGFTEWATDTAALCVDGVFYDEFLMRRESDKEN
ncbi:GNAT family N-acetyltransferase [Pantoea agglomerans]|uniref:GNAT family N-acetyltransferase n=1 Tax=Enterobacter agglomerans TaxID=549 RepID=UPI0007E5652D|nr:GNAT family N-acetyltransferase [Pantoea agglomerans]WHU89957.1 GNAT family N-acetyltransferase [Pantoea agglomerans pv. gypsophilae]WNN36647.1 GNAT family N-acetyltransferase [Pantoea agglomerans]